MKFIYKFLHFLPYIIVFFFSLYTPSDPDLGWHLKYGEYFWQHGQVLRDNTFSTMMPNYHWGNTSWFTDVISYTTYHFGGFFGLSLLGAAVVAATFFFFAKASRLTLWEKTFVFPLLLYLEAPINAISFRGQQLSLLLVGVMMYLLSRYEENPKILWFSIPLFFIWANVHGEFILGFVIFIVWLVLYLAQKLLRNVLQPQKGKTKIQAFISTFKSNFRKTRRQTFSPFAILLLSFLATFINPFGYVIHKDAIAHIGSPLLKDIAEYLPFDMYSPVWWVQVFVGVLIFAGMTYYYFKGTLWEKLPLVGGGLLLFLLSIEVRRYAWPAYYSLTPLMVMVAAYFKPYSKKMTNVTTVFLLSITLMVAIWGRMPVTRYTTFNWDKYCENDILNCSPKSAVYLQNHHLTRDLFSLYGWGGWLIWNYPQIKPTIDGRMHLWEENGYSVFVDYYALEQNMKEIDKTNYNVVYISPAKPLYQHMQKLSQQKKWKEVYVDNKAAIFVRNDSN